MKDKRSDSVVWRTAFRAFSLVEILVVVIVLGILAAMVVPKYVSATQDSSVMATAETFRLVRDQTEIFYNINQKWPADVGPTGINADLTRMFRGDNPFASETTIGGVYDWENWAGGNDIRLSIRTWGGSSSPILADLQALDEILDDGDLSKGRFRGNTGHSYLKIYP